MVDIFIELSKKYDNQEIQKIFCSKCNISYGNFPSKNLQREITLHLIKDSI